MPNFGEIKRVIDKYEEKMKKDLDELEERKLLIAQEEKASKRRIHEEKEKQEEIVRKERDSAMLKVEKKAKIVEEEKRDWEIEKNRVKATKTFEKIVTLNVGGSKYTTTLSTLTKYPDSMLGAMFSGRHALVQQEDGSYFIDRDGETFSYILSYLRDSNIVLALVPTFARELRLRLEYEARFYQLQELEDTLSLMDLQYDYVISNPARTYVKKSHVVSKYPVPTGQFIVLDYVKKMQQKSDTVNGFGGSLDVIHEPHTTDINVEINVERTNVKLESMTPNIRMHFHKKVTFYQCNLSQASFYHCYFEQPVSFEGCLMQGTKFQDVGGLVTHKVHFTPWQVSQAVFDPELLEALKAKGCIY